VQAGFGNVITLFGAVVFASLGNSLILPDASCGALLLCFELAGGTCGLSGALMAGVGALFTSYTRVILAEENGACMALGVVLASSLISLAASVYVQRIAQLEKRNLA